MSRFSDAPTLEHARVRLEQLSHAHADALTAAATTGDLWKTWYTSIPAPEGMTAEIDRRLQLQTAGAMAPYAIIDPATGTAIGMTTYMNIDAGNRRVEIGSTWLARSAQRTGINTAAKLLLLGRAFDDLDCIAVEFRTHWHNQQSRRAIAGLGAKQDGVLRNHQIDRHGALRDTVCFSIIASEWPTVKLGLEARVGA